MGAVLDWGTLWLAFDVCLAANGVIRVGRWLARDRQDGPRRG